MLHTNDGGWLACAIFPSAPIDTTRTSVSARKSESEDYRLFYYTNNSEDDYLFYYNNTNNECYPY